MRALNRISSVIFIFLTKIERNIFTTLSLVYWCYTYVFLFSLHVTPRGLFCHSIFGTPIENRIRVHEFFYDIKMTFRCVCDWNDGNGKKHFQINSKCRLNDDCCCCRFYCPYSHRQHYHTMGRSFFFFFSFYNFFFCRIYPRLYTNR